MNKFAFLEKIASLARIGINYSDNYFDKARYEQMLEACADEYTAITGLSAEYFQTVFKQEFGYITPKIGVNAIVFNQAKQVLLEQRSDDGTWGLPGGWSDMGESPQQCVIREVKEETGLEVKVVQLVDVFWRIPEGDYPYTSYHLGYLCEVIGGEIKVSPESFEVGFKTIDSIDNWHRDHKSYVLKALEL
jgi:mutator protein MutT